MLTEITSNLSIFNNEAVTSCTAHADQVFNGLRRVAWNKKLFTFSKKREYINIREHPRRTIDSGPVSSIGLHSIYNHSFYVSLYLNQTRMLDSTIKLMSSQTNHLQKQKTLCSLEFSSFPGKNHFYYQWQISVFTQLSQKQHVSDDERK